MLDESSLAAANQPAGERTLHGKSKNAGGNEGERRPPEENDGEENSDLQRHVRSSWQADLSDGYDDGEGEHR